MKTILIIIVYFGKWPEWIELFLETCKWNPTVHWLLVSDCGETKSHPENVKQISMTLPQFNRLASEKLGFDVNIKAPYKLCDLKPAYGDIFEEYINGYDYFGWGDMDVFYGDIRKFITDEMLQHEVLSFHGGRLLSNHFLILKNISEIRKAYRLISDYQEKINHPDNRHMDDEDLSAILFKRKAFMFESFSTPQDPLICWRDGTMIFPTEWYWSQGKVTNNKDRGVEFLYFHFMVWKGCGYCQGGQWKNLEKIVRVDPRRKNNGCRISAKGIFEIKNKPGEILSRTFSAWALGLLAWMCRGLPFLIPNKAYVGYLYCSAKDALRRGDKSQARKYYLAALRLQPWRVKFFLKYLRTFLLRSYSSFPERQVV